MNTTTANETSSNDDLLDPGPVDQSNSPPPSGGEMPASGSSTDYPHQETANSGGTEFEDDDSISEFLDQTNGALESNEEAFTSGSSTNYSHQETTNIEGTEFEDNDSISESLDQTNGALDSNEEAFTNGTSTGYSHQETANIGDTEFEDDDSISESLDQTNGALQPNEGAFTNGTSTDYSRQETTNIEGAESKTDDSPPDVKDAQEITNLREIHTQINIASVGNLGKVVQGSNEAAEFLDPTTEFSPSDTALPPFADQDAVRRIFEHIADQRIVVIDCLDQSVTESAIRALSDLYPRDHVWRQLLFEGRNQERADTLGLPIFDDPAKQDRIGPGRNYALVVRLNSNAQPFFESMRGSSHYVSDIKKLLRDHEISIICSVESDFIRGLLHDAKRSDSHPAKSTDNIQDCFYYWPIDFLLPCLNGSYSQDKAEYLHRKIREQKSPGLWGSGSPEDFYRLIKGLIERETLEEEVEKRNEFKGGDVDEFLRKINPVDVAELFSEDAVERAALYVATFFPNLTRPEFNRLMKPLLDGKTATIYETARHPEETEGHKTRSPVEKSLLEIWEERNDGILQKCQLTSIAKGGRRTIEFTNPYLRPALQRHLEKDYGFYVDDQFDRIWSAGFLFQLDVPQNILDNMIVLSVRMARTDPEHYWGSYLSEITEKLKTEQTDAKAEIASRLAKLIREMWGHAELRNVVRGFLDRLMQDRDFDVVLDIVLRVTRRLRFTRDFDALYWIKRLLDQAARESYKKTFRVLFDLAMQSGLRIYEFLDGLAGWLPDGNVNVRKYPRSSLSVLRLIVVYSSHGLQRLPEAAYGAWPPTYPLFAPLGDDAASRGRLRFILSAILHPVLSQRPTRDQEQSSVPEWDDLGLTVDTDLLAAEFVEQWFLVLRGTGKDFATPEALQLARMLLEEFKCLLSTGQRRKLSQHWQQKLETYRSEAAEATGVTRSQRLSRKADIRCLSQLRKEFKRINTQTETQEPRG